MKNVKIPPATWERHRRVIQHLYLKQNKELDGDDGVINIMRATHGFAASKSQYEYQFSKWRLRKNLKKQEWMMVLKTIQIRARQGKCSRVTFGKHLISDERIEREKTRYGLVMTNQPSAGDGEGLLPKLPPGIEVQTPPGNFDESDIASTVLSPRRAFSPRDDLNQTTPGERSLSATISGSPLACISSNQASHERHEIISWAADLNWSNFVLTPTDQVMIPQMPSILSQVSALFYGLTHGFEPPPIVDVQSFTPKHFLFSLVNSVNLPGDTSVDDVYNWLKSHPSSNVIQFFRALPTPTMDVLREKFFAAAMRTADIPNIRAMLDLGVDARERIEIDWERDHGPIYPLQKAFQNRNFEFVEMIVSSISKTGTKIELDSLLDKLLTYYEGEHPQGYQTFTNAQWASLIRFPLKIHRSQDFYLQGASPTVRCFAVAVDDDLLWRQLLNMGDGGIVGWFRHDLQDFCINGKTGRFSRKLLSYILHDNADQLPSDNFDIKLTLWRALRASLEMFDAWGAETIFETWGRLGIGAGSLNEATRAACFRKDWRLARTLIMREPTPDRQHKQHLMGLQQGGVETNNTGLDVGHKLNLQNIDNRVLRQKQPKLSRAYLLGIVSAGDLNGVVDELENFQHDHVQFGHWEVAMKHAVDVGRDDIAIAIIKWSSGWEGFLGYTGLLTLLQGGKTSAVRTLVRTNPQWNHALLRAILCQDYMLLEDLLYRKPAKENVFPGDLVLTSNDHQQLALRALAYCAIDSDAFDLLGWLLEAGLDMDELMISGTNLWKHPVYKGSLEGSYEDKSVQLPAMLAIVSEQNKIPWIKTLLAEGAEYQDPTVLVRAVSGGASIATINFLLDAAERRVANDAKKYGSAAIRQAIRGQNYEMIRILAARTDIDRIHSTVSDKMEGLKALSPLGEAILGGDTKAIRILLEEGANPNALVAYNDIGCDEPKAGAQALKRLSPLLAAVDADNLEMVMLLVEWGAEIDYKPKLGLLRTPLQRAAEIGNFKIVRYLLEHKATVDSNLFFGGSTALQFAAMQGYVGIAILLLEHGANPNYPPGQGDGRTAFEAAAERSRVDMMSLLMQKGVEFDLKIGDAQETQFQRACRFAEARGQMASKRFVEYLSKLHTQQIFRQLDAALGVDVSNAPNLFDV
ncbi:hypothetical protein BKA66DRAFT_565295 [Pyrenochaeta sp. MPI-SDFR-AT-0127]|nr:hypothetical protein BKA66DRAFT_565295 [Pyrenochaeta sp. MPI-SDFR-AT-0127]